MRGRRTWLLFLVVILTACQSESLEEAIQTEIPFNVARIIYIEKVKDGGIILYITEQKRENKAIEAMAVAFMKMKDGKWENVGNNHWDYKENPNMTVYINTFYDYDNKGALQNRIPVIFGELVNSSIQSVQVAGENSEYEKAKLLYIDGNKYFIKLGDYVLAEGLNNKREVIEKYEKKK